MTNDHATVSLATKKWLTFCRQVHDDVIGVGLGEYSGTYDQR